MFPLSGNKWRSDAETASCEKIDFSKVVKSVDREFLTLDDMRHLSEALCLRMDTAKPPLEHIQSAFPLYTGSSNKPSVDVQHKFRDEEGFAAGAGISRRSNYLDNQELSDEGKISFISDFAHNALDETTYASLFTTHPNKSSAAYKMASHARAEGYFALSELILSQERVQWENASGRFFQTPGTHTYCSQADDFVMGGTQIWTFITNFVTDMKSKFKPFTKNGLCKF